MALIGTFSGPPAPIGGSASANEYSTVQELLYKLPDNTANSIKAKDVRDSVFTLWERISKEISSSTASVFFQNPNPTPIKVGGIEAGSTFPDPTDMQTMWDRLLYPYIPQTSSISLNPSNREYGDPNGLVPLSITLIWSVVRNSDPIVSISVDGQSFTPTGNSQNGTKPATGTHSWVGAPVSQTNTFSMSSSDGTTNVTSSTTLTWMNNLYWGRIDLSSIGNPNLTLNPGLSPQVADLCTDFLIFNLNGAGVGSGRKLSTTKSSRYDGIDGAGQYLIFAWPSSTPGSSNPTFKVMGLTNTAFTRVRTNSNFVNQHGFSTNYEVWVSNTQQNSPIDEFEVI